MHIFNYSRFDFFNRETYFFAFRQVKIESEGIICMSQEQPTLSNGKQQIFGFTVKQWIKFLVGFIIIILIVFAGLPFAVALILHAVYPDKDFSGLMGLAEGITFIIGAIGTIASAGSIVMTLLDRKRYTEEQKLAEEQRVFVKEIDENINKMSEVLERFQSENNKMLLQILEKSNPEANFDFSDESPDRWKDRKKSHEKIRE